MNKMSVVGRVGKEVEVRYTNTGRAVAQFPIAIYQGKEKEKMWLDVIAWNHLAESCGNTIQKGETVIVEGRLQMRVYEKDDQKKRVYEIIADDIGQALNKFGDADA